MLATQGTQTEVSYDDQLVVGFGEQVFAHPFLSYLPSDQVQLVYGVFPRQRCLRQMVVVEFPLMKDNLTVEETLFLDGQNLYYQICSVGGRGYDFTAKVIAKQGRMLTLQPATLTKTVEDLRDVFEAESYLGLSTILQTHVPDFGIVDLSLRNGQ